MSHVITTNTGLSFDFDDPQPEQISVDDVAVALGNCCRFAGHVRHYYSVAEHSVLVHRLALDAGAGPEEALVALWHDAHEAYLGDCPTPLKHKIKAEAPGVWEGMEAAINQAIATKVGFDVALFRSPLIRAADREALGYEAAVLKPEGTPIYDLDLERYKTRAEAEDYVVGLPPEDAAVYFAVAHRLATS